MLCVIWKLSAQGIDRGFSHNWHIRGRECGQGIDQVRGRCWWWHCITLRRLCCPPSSPSISAIPQTDLPHLSHLPPYPTLAAYPFGVCSWCLPILAFRVVLSIALLVWLHVPCPSVVLSVCREKICFSLPLHPLPSPYCLNLGFILFLPGK